MIHDAWAKALWNWPDTTSGNLPNKQDLLFQLGEVEQSIYTLSVAAQILTFPDLVNQKLMDMHTGEKLDFFHIMDTCQTNQYHFGHPDTLDGLHYSGCYPASRGCGRSLFCGI